MDSGSDKVEFKPPQGFKAPENIAVDKDFDLVCTFRLKPDGTLCMTKLGDSDMPGYGSNTNDNDADDKQETKPDYRQYSQELSQDISAAAAQPQQQTY